MNSMGLLLRRADGHKPRSAVTDDLGRSTGLDEPAKKHGLVCRWLLSSSNPAESYLGF